MKRFVWSAVAIAMAVAATPGAQAETPGCQIQFAGSPLEAHENNVVTIGDLKLRFKRVVPVVWARDADRPTSFGNFVVDIKTPDYYANDVLFQAGATLKFVACGVEVTLTSSDFGSHLIVSVF